MTTRALSRTITVDMDTARELWDSGPQDGANRIRLMTDSDGRYIWAETNGDPIVDRAELRTLLDEHLASYVGRWAAERERVMQLAGWAPNGLDLRCDECHAAPAELVLDANCGEEGKTTCGIESVAALSAEDLQRSYGDDIVAAIPLCRRCSTALHDGDRIASVAAEAYDRAVARGENWADEVDIALSRIEVEVDAEATRAANQDGHGPLAILIDGRQVWRNEATRRVTVEAAE